MSKYETPDYEVLLKDDKIEIRKYCDFYIVEHEGCLGGKSGFQTLFSYISSDNKENEKISMTVPVIQQEFKENKTMAFVVPGKFGDQIPQPNNPNLKIKTFEEGVFAVIRYSGFSTKSKEEKMKDKLGKWLIGKNYTKQSDYMSASYNAPFVLPMFRRNEVWVRVKLN